MAETVLADFRLSRRMREVMEPLARIVCPPELDALGLTEPVLDHVELSMRSLPAALRLGLVAGATSFELGAALRHGGRFSRLSRAKQEAYFASWWSSPFPAFHQFAKGVKALLALAYWELPAVRQRMAYHPERWIAEVAARRLATYADDIRRHDELVIADDPLVVPIASITRRKARDDQAA